MRRGILLSVRVWWQIARAVRAGIADGILDAAAALAFYFLFALFPLVLLLAALPGTAHKAGLVGSIIVGLSHSLPRDAARLVTRQLEAVLATRHQGLLSVGTALTLYSASMGFSGLIAGLNRAYRARETRSYVHQLLLALGLMVSAGTLLVCGFALLLLSARVLEVISGGIHLGAVLTVTWPVIRWSGVAGLFILAIVLLYRAAPNLSRRARPLWPGALFAFIVWMMVSGLLAAYVDNLGHYSAVYGSLGAVIALMLWFYFLALALLLGAELDRSIGEERGRVTATRGGAGGDAKAA